MSQLEENIKASIAVDLSKWLTKQIRKDGSTVGSLTIQEMAIMQKVLSEYFGCKFELQVVDKEE